MRIRTLIVPCAAVLITVLSGCRDKSSECCQYTGGLDTVFITIAGFWEHDYIIPKLLSKQPDTGGYVKAKLQLDFYFENKKTASQLVSTDYYSKNGHMTAGFGFTLESASGKAPGFFKVRIGDPMMNPKRECLLFYRSPDSTIQLVDRWQCQSGSEVTEETEIFANDRSNAVTHFWTRHYQQTLSRIDYSDSLSFTKVNGRWTMKRLSPKGKIIRTRQHKQI